MRKTVDLFVVPDDPGCMDVQEFLQQQDLHLQIRDVSKKPLGTEEIAKLIRHFNLEHFLNTSSKVYSSRRLDKFMPSRQQVIALMAEDNDLIRKPIIVAGRLMVVGPNRSKIMEMLQLKTNGADPADQMSSDRARRQKS